MIIKLKKPNHDLSRRAILRGIGASLTLPWLESFNAPAWGESMTLPKRFFTYYTPNGYNMSLFWPTETGPLLANSLQGTSLSPLSPHFQNLLLVNGLNNHPASSQGDGPGDHARGTSTTLTCVHPLKSADQLSIGTSVDQHLADLWNNETSIRSLEIGCEGGGNAGSCDSGYSCAYSRNISWSDNQTPLPKEVNPRLLFNRLFGSLDPNQSPAAITQRQRRRQSVLDFVLADTQQLKNQVSASDQHRVDSFLTGIREVERRLQSQEESQCQPGSEMPIGIPASRQDHAQLLIDLAISAFRCDLTRVATFMLGNGGSNKAYNNLGISEGHHALSHHQNDPIKLAQIASIDLWQMELFAHLLQGLSEIEEGNGTLLDQCTVLGISEVADGNAHRHYELPVVLAGRVADLNMGRYLDLRSNNAQEPIANLYLKILNDAGSPLNNFGDDGINPFNI
ncbi:MAG: hypothetical protein CMH49_06635 [Myxococcales bacterium]|nr:hypothetical protein [Myxococcales bacterium]